MCEISVDVIVPKYEEQVEALSYKIEFNNK